MSDESKDADAALRAAEVKLGIPMHLAQLKFQLSIPDADGVDAQAVKAEALAIITEDEMGPYYESMCTELGWTPDAELSARFKAANEKELKEKTAKIEDAKENFGEVEVLDAIVALADFHARIGNKDEALKMYLEPKEQKQSLGQKIDMILKAIRVCLVHGDLAQAKTHIETAHELAEKGGDWDRRNRLKVYQGTYFVATRQFDKAATLFLDSVATFTCYEMYSYNKFVFYLVVVALLSLDRKTLRMKVVESPEVLTCIRELPHAERLLTSFYGCRYKDFFNALVEMHPHIFKDRFLNSHAKWYLREVRIKAYSQFLESYKSVTAASMAAAFGVGVEFLDRELSRFIAVGRIHAKIDKIDGIIETNRPDAKNAQYSELIQQGDELLNSIQQLARMLSV